MINDQNFQKEIEKNKFTLVDFFANWCEPCKILAPILEKTVKEFEKVILFEKVNVDNIPLIAQKMEISRIPLVVLFKEGKPLSGFIGVKKEEEIKEWLERVLEKEITEWAKDYAQKNNFKLKNKKVVKGLLNNEKKYGKRYCPCRRITGDEKEDQKNVCPCVFHKKEIEKDGHCFCQLFKS